MLEQSGCEPVSFSKLQKVQAVLHALHLSLMHPSHKHPRVTLPDLEVFVLRPQQVLCGNVRLSGHSKSYVGSSVRLRLDIQQIWAQEIELYTPSLLI